MKPFCYNFNVFSDCEGDGLQAPVEKIDVSITVVIPVLNEAQILEESVSAVEEALKAGRRCDWQIVIVDDGSADDTYSVMKRISEEHERVVICRHERNEGLGEATRTGFEHASGDIIVTLDADLSYRPEYINKLADSLVNNGADISIASPYAAGGAVRNVPWHRLALSRYGNMMMRWALGYGIYTYTSMVRAYRKSTVSGLSTRCRGSEFQLEILMEAHSQGLRIAEVPAVLEWREPVKEGGASRKRPRAALPVAIFAHLALIIFRRPLSQRKRSR